MIRMTATLNRILLATAFIWAMVSVWLQLENLSILEQALLAIFGIVVTVTTDYALGVIDRLSNPMARTIARGIVWTVHGSVVLLLPVASIASLTLAGAFAVIGAVTQFGIVHVAAYADEYLFSAASPSASSAITVRPKETAVSSVARYFRARHGAYRLHPLTQSLLYYA